MAASEKEAQAIADFLSDFNSRTLRSLFEMRAGVDTDDMMRSLDTNRWFTPQQAVEAGLADSIIEIEDNSTRDKISARMSARRNLRLAALAAA